MKIRAFFCILLLISFFPGKAYAQLLPNSLWKIKYASSQEPIYSLPNGSAERILDGDKSTFWHSQYSDKKAHNPHEIQIDLGALALLKGVVLVPRQNNSSGRCAEYELQTSVDGIHWRMVKRASLFWSMNGDFSDKTIDFSPPVEARYISYKHLKTFNNGLVDTTVASLADIKMIGEYIRPVVVADFTFETSKPYYLVGEEIKLKNSSKAYLSDIQKMEWSCPGAEIRMDSRKNMTLKYTRCGYYDVSLTVSNAAGFSSQKKQIKRICILPGMSLDRHKWHIVSFSEEDVEHKESVYNVIDSVIESSWSTTWDQLKPLPHFIAFDLGETTEINGFGYLPIQGYETKGLVTSWKLFVSNDGRNWGKAISSGTWTYENRDLKIVSIKKNSCRFVKFQMDKTLPIGSDFASCAEFYLFSPASHHSFNYSGLLIVLSMVFILFFFFKRKRRKTKPAPEKQTKESENTTTQLYLFGEFKIISENKDMTVLFYSKIKQLFLLLLCYSEGISIHKLTSLIWPGMPADKAVNNRSTNIRNLKNVLAEASGIQLEYATKSWKIVLDPTVYCDFYEYKNLIANLSKKKDVKSILRICQIVERGTFLAEMDAEWLDDIKEKITEEIIEEFTSLLSDGYAKFSSDLILRIAECMLIFDEVNELAIKHKIKILISQQKNSSAKTSFDNFVRKYKLFYNQDFSGDFSSFLD